jgi:hypothetical protein
MHRRLLGVTEGVLQDLVTTAEAVPSPGFVQPNSPQFVAQCGGLVGCESDDVVHPSAHAHSRNGEQFEPDTVSDTFRKPSRTADLPPVRLHAMRSGAATMALAAGIPMKTVSEMLGHASEAITSKIYTAVGDELKRGAITPIGALIPRRATGTEKSS